MEEVIQRIKHAIEGKHQWIDEARDRKKKHNAIVNGEGFMDLLLHIEGVEDSVRAIARKKYTKDIRSTVSKLMNLRNNVFHANGGNEEDKLSDTQRQQFNSVIKTIKGNKSLHKYLADNFFDLQDIDPNGVVLMQYAIDELTKEAKPSPVYKSIDDIVYYEADGQQVKYIILNTGKDKEHNTVYRYIDSDVDLLCTYRGRKVIVQENSIMPVPFSDCPALILSDKQRVGSEIRESMIDEIYPDLEDFARNKSILTIYRVIHGVPYFWEYAASCETCYGSGKTLGDMDEEMTCTSCDGNGLRKRRDVTSAVQLTMPRNNADPIITPNIAGYIQPDIATWKQLKEDLTDATDDMFASLWGTNYVSMDNNTATGKWIDTQPITNRLDELSSTVEWVHNKLANWVLEVVIKTALPQSPYRKVYGRRFIIDSPDTILDKYIQAKNSGLDIVILDNVMREYISSKYKTDPSMEERMTTKFILDPFRHHSLDEVNAVFGTDSALAKQAYEQWWVMADHNKSVDQLRSDRDAYINQFKIDNYENVSSERVSQGAAQQAVLGREPNQVTTR